MTAQPATVVLVGAGASPLVVELAALGLDVIATDIAQSALDALAAVVADATGSGDRAAAGRAPAGSIEYVHADVCDLVLRRHVDTWHDRAVLHFLTDPAQQSAYAAAVGRGVRLGGHVVLATFAPGGPERCSGLAVQQHDAGSLATLLGSDFELAESFERDHHTPGGGAQRFTHAVFRRIAGAE